MDRQHWQICFLLGLLLGLLWLAPVSAQAPGTVAQEQVTEVARELYCPTCSGVPVSTCGIQVCTQMKEVIASKLAAGESKEQIKQYFVEQFGQRVLAQPERQGVNLLLAWILPGAVLLTSVGGALLWLRGRTKAVAPAPSATPHTPYHEQLERELKRLES